MPSPNASPAITPPSTPPPPPSTPASRHDPTPPRSHKRRRREVPVRQAEAESPDVLIKRFITNQVHALHDISSESFSNPATSRGEEMLRATIATISALENSAADSASPKYHLAHKPGFGGGFIITNCASNQSYFAKNFLNPPQSYEADFREFFVYKLLEHLGYGAKCHFGRYGESAAFLISTGLTQKTSDSAKTFYTFKEIAAHDISLPISRENIEHQMAVQILVSLLDLLDVRSNDENSGIVLTHGPKTTSAEPKAKTKIIDFTIAPKEEKERPSSKIGLEDVVKILDSPNYSSFTHRFAAERKGQAYKSALQNLFDGRKSRPPLRAAIKRAYHDCQLVMGGKKDDLLETQIAELHERIDKLEGYFSTISAGMRK